MTDKVTDAIKAAFAAAAITGPRPTFHPTTGPAVEDALVGMDAARFEAALREAGYEVVSVWAGEYMSNPVFAAHYVAARDEQREQDAEVAELRAEVDRLRSKRGPTVKTVRDVMLAVGMPPSLSEAEALYDRIRDALTVPEGASDG